MTKKGVSFIRSDRALIKLRHREKKVRGREAERWRKQTQAQNIRSTRVALILVTKEKREHTESGG